MKKTYCLWQITKRCNLKCSYCNIPSDKDTKHDKIFKDIKYLNITGGEPMLSAQLFNVFKFFPNVKIIQVSTNGLLVDKLIKFISFYSSRVQLRITISLHADNYHNQLKCYHTLKKKGVKVGLQMMVMNLRSYNFRASKIFPMKSDFYGNPSVSSVNLLSEARRLSKEIGLLRPYYKNVLSVYEGNGRIVPCTFRDGSACYVDVDGKVHICPYEDVGCEDCIGMCDGLNLYLKHPIKMLSKVVF